MKQRIDNHPIGTERLWAAGRPKDKYMYVKIAADMWKLKHHIVWEEHNGKPIPPDHKIIFRDGNKLNFAIDNLHLLPNSQSIERSQFSSKSKYRRRTFAANPHTHEIGTEVYYKHYGWHVKVDDKTWKPKKLILWEAEYSKVPEHAIVKYKDGDMRNCTLENLYLHIANPKVKKTDRKNNIQRM